MKKALLLGLVVLLVVGCAVAVYGKAEKEDLVLAVHTSYNQTGTPVGFAILNNPAGPDNLIVQVSLKKVPTEVTYYVFLEEYYPNQDFWGFAEIGTLTVNNQGNGNAHFNLNPSIVSPRANRRLSLMLTPGTHHLQIAICTAGGTWIWATNAVPIALK